MLGLFQGSGDGGVILQFGDKPRRLRLHDSVDGWVLTTVQERGATFERSGQTRTLQLLRAKHASTLVPLAALPVPAPLEPKVKPESGSHGDSKLRRPVFGGSRP